jgi:glycosyltransferase involved in cell wall biosynthesis
VRVLLCASGDSRLEVDRLIPSFERGQFAHIAEPYNATMGIAHAHMQVVVEELVSGRENIDLVHDHLEVVGPAMLGAMGAAIPPVLQTLHWDLRKHPDFYGSFDGRNRVRFCGVSDRQVFLAPARLRDQTLGAVPLAVDVDRFPFEESKDGPFLVLGRIAAIKGPDIAARACRSAGSALELAGPVAGIDDPAALDAALADPQDPVHGHADAAFFTSAVKPHLGGEVRWIGSVEGEHKLSAALSSPGARGAHPVGEPGARRSSKALACGNAGHRDEPRRAPRPRRARDHGLSSPTMRTSCRTISRAPARSIRGRAGPPPSRASPPAPSPRPTSSATRR